MEDSIPNIVPLRRLGMWWFMGSEIVTFGGLIVCYILMHNRHPEWSIQASHTILWVGTINTVVLLTSSLTVILSHYWVENQDRERAAKFLVYTILLGLVFMGFKAYEYAHEVAAGLLPDKSLFWSFYYLMTGLHLLHVIGGVVALFVVYLGVKKGVHAHRVESVGIYWHFVDIVWIYLFPLLYMVS